MLTSQQTGISSKETKNNLEDEMNKHIGLVSKDLSFRAMGLGAYGVARMLSILISVEMRSCMGYSIDCKPHCLRSFGGVNGGK